MQQLDIQGTQMLIKFKSTEMNSNLFLKIMDLK